MMDNYHIYVHNLPDYIKITVVGRTRSITTIVSPAIVKATIVKYGVGRISRTEIEIYDILKNNKAYETIREYLKRFYGADPSNVFEIRIR